MELEHLQNLFSIWNAGRTKLNRTYYGLISRLEKVDDRLNYIQVACTQRSFIFNSALYLF